MTIDKSWTTCRRRNSDEFWNGLQAFIEIAKKYVNSDGRVSCPCKKCLNFMRQTPDMVDGHIFRYGFQAAYTKWVYHGEVDTPSPVAADVAPTTDEMTTDVINDIIGETKTNEEHADEGTNEGGSGVDKEFGVSEWPKILASVERDCQDHYRDGKSKLKNHFDRVGGYDDVEKARRNPPPDLEPGDLDKTVDLSVDSKYKSRSKKNAQNRSHAKSPNLHGSPPYIATEYKKNPKTQESQGPKDNSHHMHYKPSDGGVNDLPRINHEAMLREQVVQTQEHGSTSSSVKEKEIITKVLGKRRGHNRGIGRKLKGPVSSSLFEPPTPPSPPPPPPPPMPPSIIDAMKNVVDALNAFSSYMHQMYTSLPGNQLPPPPVIDTRALEALVMSGQPPQQPPQ